MKRALIITCALGVGCASAPAPCPNLPASASASVSAPASASASSSGSASASAPASVTLLLRPIAQPKPLVHVEVDVDAPGAPLTIWRIAGGTVDRVVHAAAHDASGEIGVSVKARAQGPAIELVLERATKGPVHLAYDVLTGDDSPDDPLGLLVLEDRFRGAGEKLVALPESIEDTPLPIALKIDGDALRAEKAASSLGIGPVRRTRARPRALRYASFVAGSMGASVIDAIEGHDEGAWLGYTAFDPRPAIAELAQVRTGLAELFKAQGMLPGPPWTYLVVSQSRPIGSFTTTPRYESVLLQVGPSEPWGAPLRLSVAQQLARRWIGDVLRFAMPAGHEWEAGWFNEGVARYVATRLLAKLGLLTPGEWREAIAGELSVLATSPHAKLDNAALAALAPKDPVARATMMARGALYAARESAVIRARTKGERDLENALVVLLRQAGNDESNATRPLPAGAWIDALAKDDPDAARSFDAIVTRGGPIELPNGALGPCFRAGTGEYVAFDPGFDVEATRTAADERVVGLRADGPAAKAGLREGDVVESMAARDGDAEVPVKMVVSRAGENGGQKVSITYAPRGAHGRGQTWTRVKGVGDDRCGDPP